MQQESIGENKVIFNSKVSAGNKSDGMNLKYNYYSMLFLNINSFMGGVTDIWQKAKQN